MRKILVLAAFLGVSFAMLPPGSRGQQDNDTDLAKLLELASQKEPKEARRLLQKAIRLLSEQKKDLPEGNLWIRKITEIFPRVVHTPEEVLEVLGPQKQVARQIYFQRYREQWIYEAPWPLVVVFDTPKGQEPTLRTVRPLPNTLP